MNENNCSDILDSVGSAGIYVIREDDHRILYFNKLVKNAVPNVKIGMLCSEIWNKNCEKCPLIDNERNCENRSFNVGYLSGKAYDITAKKMMWDNKIPAYVISFTLHAEIHAVSYENKDDEVCDKGIKRDELQFKNEAILKILGTENFGIYLVDLNTGKMECVKSTEEDKTFIKSVNDSWDDVVSDLVKFRYHKNYRDKFKNAFSLNSLRKLKNSGKDKYEALFERNIGGVFKYVKASCFFHTDYSGEEYAVLSFLDSDDYARREIGHVKNERRMAAVVRSRFDILNYVELDSGKCETVTVNKDGADKTSFGNYDEFLHMDLEDVYENDRENFLDSLSLENLSEKYKSGLKNEIVQYRTGKKDNLRWRERQIFYMQQNDLSEVDIFERDVTEEKLREERENRIAAEKKNIINSLSSMFIASGIVDLYKGTCRKISRRSSEVADVLDEERIYNDVINEFAYGFVHPDDRKEYLQKMNLESFREELSEDHPILSCEYREYYDNEYKWVRACAVVSELDGNKVKTAVYIVQDINESKQKELESMKILRDALDTANFANSAKNEFLSRISHDIRTPMNAIVGMTAIAGTHLDDPTRVADCLNKITLSGKHLLSLINEVLDLNKIESGRVDISEEEFMLSDFFGDIITIIQPAVNAKHQQLEFRLYNVTHENVVGDSLHLQQVVSNILSNAVKYTGENGKIEVEIYEKPSKVSGYGNFEFVFKDNGIGMSEEYLKHIFEPFSREKKSDTEKSESYGLGMAIAYNIVQMMNGDISVKSKVGEGTQFRVSLFLKLCNSKNEKIKEFIDLPVLVADDDKDSCEAACQILDELGMKSEFVLTGKEAVEKTACAHENNDDYFAVILDWKMPGMDGIETAREIRKKVGEEVPIIILSAYDWSDVEEEAQKAGINGFISKPLFRSRLIYIFRQFIDGNSIVKNEVTELTSIKEKDYSDKRILLVEDNDLNREIAAEIIGMTGVKIECAVNGEEAVNKFEQSPINYYDLIFMDIRMPIMDGYEATRTIRSLDRADSKSVPIIAMSANAFTTDIIAGKNAGMNEHMIKPLNFKRLSECLEKWLG